MILIAQKTRKMALCWAQIGLILCGFNLFPMQEKSINILTKKTPWWWCSSVYPSHRVFVAFVCVQKKTRWVTTNQGHCMSHQYRACWLQSLEFLSTFRERERNWTHKERCGLFNEILQLLPFTFPKFLSVDFSDICKQAEHSNHWRLFWRTYQTWHHTHQRTV